MINTSNFARLSLLAPTLGILAGCTVGPNYVRPNYTPPPAFRGADEAPISSDAKNSLGDEQWSSVYREPELQDLIRKALANNYDVRIAAERILEQQAQVRITRSQQFPSITVGGSAIGATLPSSLGTQLPNPLVEGSFNVSAAWTPDFWGLYRRQTEAARAQLLAQTWAQRAVRLTLVQQVATAYLQIRALDAQLEITRATIKVRQDSVGLTKTLESGGSVPLSDVRQAEQLLYAATSEVPQLEEQIQQQENGLRLLMGENPGPIAHRIRMHLLLRPRTLPAGLPSQLLERGPIFSRQRPLLSPPMRKSAWPARSFSPICRSALQVESAVTVSPASSIPRERQFTALVHWRSRSSKAESFAGNSSFRKKPSKRWC